MCERQRLWFTPAPSFSLIPMDAKELLAALRAAPGAREIRVPEPLTDGVVVAGVEVVSVATAPERTLRRLWRGRHGGGATPLILVADDASREGSVLTLGAVDAGAPLRAVSADALLRVLERVAPLPRLEAVREIAAELERLDQAGIPGLKVRELLTVHTLDTRLRRDPVRWPRLAELAKAAPAAGDWRATVSALGYDLERRRHRGWLARYEGRPIAVIHPKADPVEFARLDEDGRPPEGVLLNDCRSDGADYGILAAGSRLRLFQVASQAGSASSRYIDLDTASLQEDDRPFLGLLAPQYLAEGDFTELEVEARAFGAELRLHVDEQIRQSVLPSLARAFGTWAEASGLDVAEDANRTELERAALTLVFRALFILYAESANYLPIDHRSYQTASLSALVDEAAASSEALDPRSTSLWDRFVLLVKAMRTGNTAWAVPAYNGALFAPAGFEGAETLERIELNDVDFGSVLVGLGRDASSEQGLDYSTLEVGHLGHIYEGLLSLRLSVADRPLRYDPRRDHYETVDDVAEATVQLGDLLWQTHEGGRKGGGVYYTRTELVRHLVRQTVVPAFEQHLARVRELATSKPADAADSLFDFAVLDPACGSAHFLVEVVNELADIVIRFLAEVPLPRVAEALDRLRSGASAGTAIDDVALIRRLVVKRCVYGVDLSPMGAEVAKLSLWLASFVSGLSLAYLDRNVIVGNSLIGVVRTEALLEATGLGPLFQDPLENALREAAEAARKIAASEDRTPEEIRASEEADAEARASTAGLDLLFDAWTAQPLGADRARQEVELHAPDVIAGRTNKVLEEARRLADEMSFLHWPLAFPTIFSRERSGFDAVIGNPPWEEVTVERLAFYGLFQPGLRSLPQRERETAIQELLADRPDLEGRLAEEQERAALQRRYLNSDEYESMSGDPDLYKFFSQRYRGLLANGGVLGVVLPRSVFITDGSAGFRTWLFEENTCRRIDFLLNSGRWAFDSEPRYTIALVAARSEPAAEGHTVAVAGIAKSLAEWHAQIASSGIDLLPGAFGPAWTVPLLRSQAEADLLAKVRVGDRFPRGGGRWRCFPVAELHETNDRQLWESARKGDPLWKGESFDQYEPHGAEARVCPRSKDVMKKIQKPRPGAGSLVASEATLEQRQEAVLNALAGPRVVFRDVSRATDSRTVRAVLAPPGVLLTNKAPYVAFVEGDNRSRAACLGVMNSLPFDWQARRFVEVNLNFFILEGLIVPDLPDDHYERIATCAARLSCIEDRFGAFAESVGVECGPLADEEYEALRAEIDARVATSWKLTAKDLKTMFRDFSEGAVPQPYQERLLEQLAALK
jgi:Eco57I restriction-modification methylase